MSGKYISPTIRDQIILRAGGRCEYCKSLWKYAIHTFHIDHITPLKKKGITEIENLAFACGGCNSSKSTKMEAWDPVSMAFVPLFNPRTDRWEDHFSWSNDYLEMIGETAIGRASISQLRLNRAGLRNTRGLTLMIGEHPPET